MTVRSAILAALGICWLALGATRIATDHRTSGLASLALGLILSLVALFRRRR